MRAAVCFLHVRCIRFDHSRSISLTNQQHFVFCHSEELVTSHYCFQLQPQTPELLRVGMKEDSSAEHGFLCVFLTMFFAFSSERPQIVWLSYLSLWLQDFVWANFQFSLWHHAVPCVYHCPLLSHGELSGHRCQ